MLFIGQAFVASMHSGSMIYFMCALSIALTEGRNVGNSKPAAMSESADY